MNDDQDRERVMPKPIPTFTINSRCLKGLGLNYQKLCPLTDYHPRAQGMA